MTREPPASPSIKRGYRGGEERHGTVQFVASIKRIARDVDGCSTVLVCGGSSTPAGPGFCPMCSFLNTVLSLLGGWQLNG